MFPLFNHDFISIVVVNPFGLTCEHFSDSSDVSELLSNTPDPFERVRERVRMCDSEKLRECVFVCVRERNSLIVCMCVCACAKNVL